MRRFSQHSLLYLIGKALGKGSLWVLSIAAAAALAPSAYSRVALFLAGGSFLAPILGLGGNASILRFSVPSSGDSQIDYDRQGQPRDKRTVNSEMIGDPRGAWGLSLTVNFIFLSLFGIAVVSLSPLFPRLDYVLLVGTAIYATLLSQEANLVAFLQTSSRSAHFVRYQLTVALALTVGAGGSILLGAPLGLKLADTIIVATLIAITIGLSWGLRFVVRVFGLPQKTSWSQALSYGGPLVFHLTSMSALGFADIFLVELFLGSHASGLYGFGYRVAMIQATICSAVALAWLPDFYAKVTRNEVDDVSGRSVMVICFLAVTALLIPSGGLALVNYAELPYSESTAVMFLVSAGYLYYSAYVIFNGALTYHGDTGLLARNTAIAALLNIFLNVLGISIFGVNGAALSTLISFGILALLQGHVVHQRYMNLLPVTKLLGISTVGAVVILSVCIVTWEL